MKHFIYQDEKSHKFWAVEQQGNELHICPGKFKLSHKVLLPRPEKQEKK